jgi:putative DNA primase/helicase
LYIDGEISEDEMQDRILKLKIGRKAEQVPFYLLSSDEMRSNDKRSPNLNNPSWRSSISEYLKSHPDIGLVILDNLSSLTPGRDENKKRDWDEINGWLLELRSKGVAVIFLHHEGKGGDQRGTSAIEDNINFSIRLKRPEGYRKEDGTKFVVEFTKSRRLHGENIKSFTLKLQEEGMVLDWKVIADEEQNTEAQIIKSLKEGMKQKDIAKTLGVSASWVSQVVTKAKEEERIKRIDAVLGDDEEQIKDASEAEEVEIGDDVEVIEE